MADLTLGVTIRAISATGKRYIASDSGEASWKEGLKHCPVPEELKLKVGAQVMLLKNLDLHRGLSNGSQGNLLLVVTRATHGPPMPWRILGVVVGFDESRDGYPVVRFLSDASLTVMPAKWTIEHPLGTVVAVRSSFGCTPTFPHHDRNTSSPVSQASPPQVSMGDEHSQVSGFHS